jgi:hypothetical protein
MGTRRRDPNHAENFFSQLKRSIVGTHHHVTKGHLHRYVAEFTFRYNTCQLSDETGWASSSARPRVGG